MTIEEMAAELEIDFKRWLKKNRPVTLVAYDRDILVPCFKRLLAKSE